MTLPAISHLLSLALTVSFWLLFMVTSMAERKTRAALISAISAIFSISLWSCVWLYAQPLVLIGFNLAWLLALVIFYLPFGCNDSIRIDSEGELVDERDTMFAREEYSPGSEKYRLYYDRYPERKEIDDRLRQLPELFAPGGRYYDRERSEALAGTFDEIEALSKKVDGVINSSADSVDPVAMTDWVRNVLLEGGADAVGVARLNPRWVYSHVGRGYEPWGERIRNTHKHVIVFTVEMDYFMVEGAPDLPITEETATRYLQASRLSTRLAHEIRERGYAARAHVAGSNYQIMLPPVAYEAGLGELGRLGYVISPTLGARVRLGAITTDLPLTISRPISFGVQDFCRKCQKCADSCPSRAIPSDEVRPDKGVWKWSLDIEQCFRYWRTIGTDCGLCMKVCPYSHPPTLAHRIIRGGIKRSALARTLSVIGDDILYGRKPSIPKPREIG